MSTPTRTSLATPGMPPRFERIRFFTAPAEGSPPAPTPTPPPAPAPAPAAPPAPAQEPDWKAEARKWEDRAKENKKAADRLAELEESQKTEAQKLADRAAAAEAKAAGYEREKQVDAWKADVAKTSGVPAAALAGSTLEEIQAHAELLKPLIATSPETPVPPAGPTVPGEGGTPPAGVAQLTKADLLTMTPDQINKARREGRLNKVLGVN